MRVFEVLGLALEVEAVIEAWSTACKAAEARPDAPSLRCPPDAERLAISDETARSRGKALRRKLGASSRAQVVAKAHALGLVRQRNEIEGF